jgi:hypothetical protein
MVYVNRPQTIQDVKDNIRAEISQIPQNMLQKVMNGARRRVELCFNSGGVHVSDVIFKK